MATLLDKILIMVFWPKEQTGTKGVCTFEIKENGEDWLDWQMTARGKERAGRCWEKDT